MKLFLNFAAFQLGWFACVLGGANQMPWLGTLVAALIISWHLSLAQRPGRELTLLIRFSTHFDGMRPVPLTAGA